MKTDIYSHAIVHVTFQCNMNCPKCTQRGLRVIGNMLTERQFIRILQRTTEQTTIKSLTLTGGEPTLWGHLRWAIDEAKLRVEKVIVITNGVGRCARDYGNADKVLVTNYGAINRTDMLRLKRGLGRRFGVSNTCQLAWPLSVVQDSLPAVCRCAHLFFAGDKVWACQAAVYSESGLSIEEDFVSFFRSHSSYMQSICRNCVSNLKARKHVQPGPTLEISLWNTRFMLLWSSKHKWAGLRKWWSSGRGC